MVTILPEEKNGWGNIGERFGSGVAQGYANRADESAIQNAITALGPTASGRQVLDALTKTKTYNPESKQTFLNNFLGVEKMEELKKQATANQEIARQRNEALTQKSKLKQEIDETKKAEQESKDINDALTLIDEAKDLSHEQKENLRNKAKNKEASFDAIKEVLKGAKPTKEENDAKAAKESKEITQKSFDELVNLIPEVGRSGILTSKLGGDTAKSFAKFQTLTGALESNLVELVNRGTLSNTRFKYITEQLLPKPSDTQKEIQGKLEGLALMLDLDGTALGVESSKDSKGRPGLSSFEVK
jgi:hypothetical protein